MQGRRGCLGRAVLWEPANKPSTAVPGLPKPGLAATRGSEFLWSSTGGSWALLLQEPLAFGFVGSHTTSLWPLFSSSSAEKLHPNKSCLTFSFPRGCVAAAGSLQSEGTTGGDIWSPSTPASHLWDLWDSPHMGRDTATRPLVFLKHIKNLQVL